MSSADVFPATTTAARRTRQPVAQIPNIFRTPFLALIVAVGAYGSADTDVWGHLRFGLDILQARAIPRADHYAFTSIAPWINHEWGSDILLALAYQLGGLVGLTVIRAACAAMTVALVNHRLRVMAWPWRDLVLLAVIVALVPLTFAVRPQIFSLPLYALTLLLLSESRRQWWLPVVFLLWANLHGGWLIGFGAVAVYAMCHPSRRHVAIAALCLLATLANPFGVHLWFALFEAMRRGWGDVVEWQPIWSLSAGRQPAWLWAVTTLAGIIVLTRRRPADRFAWAWALVVAIAALRVQRHGPFYALTVAMLVPSPASASAPSALPSTPPVWTVGSRLMAALLVAIGLGGSIAVLWPTLTCLPPTVNYPDVRPESSSTRFIQSAQLSGRMLTWFSWGEYAIWHIGDRVKISIDNRRETVYDAETVARHRDFYFGTRPTYADEIAADYVWLRRDLPAVAQLKARGWFALFDGPESTILGRQFRPTVTGLPDVLTPCFPQP